MGSLLHAVETGKPLDIPGSDNLKTIALCEAVLAGAASTGSCDSMNSRDSNTLVLASKVTTFDLSPISFTGVVDGNSFVLWTSILIVLALSAAVHAWWWRRQLRLVRLSLGSAADQRQSDSESQQTEVFYHSLVETIPQMILCKDLEGRFTFANQKFCVELGRTLEEIKGKTDFDFFPKELAEKYRRDDCDVLAKGQIIDIVEEHVTPKGEKLYVQVMKTPLYSADGTPIGIQGIFWNVTERMRAEETLKHQMKSPCANA